MRSFWIALTYLVFACADTANGQIYMGLGPQVDFPLMYNKAVGDYNHSLGAFGGQLSLRYIPQNTTFYPSLSLNATSIRLPLLKLTDVVVNMHFLQFNAEVGINSYTQLAKGELHYGLGIGISYLNGRGTELTGSSEDKELLAPAPYIKTWMPAFNAGLEYILPISSEKPLFAGIGGKVQYIYFFDNGVKYAATIVDTYQGAIPVQANLQGQMVNPGVYVVVYYKFGQGSRYY